jgi:hypothetical protein
LENNQKWSVAPMPRSELTGTRIRERRLAIRMRQADLARAAGISASYLNLIEHNKRRIAGKLLADIAGQLEVDYTELMQGADQALLEAVTAAGAAQGLDDNALMQAEAMIRGFPAWAGLITRQADRIAALERSVDALNDRLTHDPALAEAMHEVLSTVSAVRSTASILVSTPEIDPNWLGRFHANLDQDSRRLADGAEAMVNYFETQAKRGPGFLAPAELAAAYLETAQHHFPSLETCPPAQLDAQIEALCAQAPDDPNARTMLGGALAQYHHDAQLLPLEILTKAIAATGIEPLTLAEGLGVPLDCVLRRLASLPPEAPAASDIGLLVIDSAGAARARRAVAGFALPLVTAGCPLWPLYQSLARPHYPVQARLALPDGSLFDATAIALPAARPRPGLPEVLHATMLVHRVPAGGKAPAQSLPVGVTCRICTRTDCTARREPSLLTPAAPAKQATAV